MKHATLKQLSSAVITCLCAALLQGCAPVVLAGGSTAAIVANDERTAGSFVEDQEIELKVLFQLNEEIGDQANVNTTSYNRNVLLTGQVPSEAIRKHVLNVVNGVDNVQKVYDQLQLGNPSSLTSRASDSALTARVKATLCGLRDDGFSCLDVKVVTESGVVYLMGLVTAAQEKSAVHAASRVGGVLKVVTLFERLQ